MTDEIRSEPFVIAISNFLTFSRRSNPFWLLSISPHCSVGSNSTFVRVWVREGIGEKIVGIQG